MRITTKMPITMDENLNNLGIGNLAEYFNTTTVKMVIITPEAKTPKRIALDCLPEDSELSAERNNTDQKLLWILQRMTMLPSPKDCRVALHFLPIRWHILSICWLRFCCGAKNPRRATWLPQWMKQWLRPILCLCAVRNKFFGNKPKRYT